MFEFSIYCVMLIEFILKVIVMWIVYWEMMEWKWMLMNFFEIDWIMSCCWVEDWGIDLCWWLKNDLSYEIVDWKFVEMDWNDELCELFVFDGNELVV